MKKILFVAAAVALLGLGSNAASASEAQSFKLKDSENTVEITNETATIIEKDGTKSPAPDGTHELAEGQALKAITTKDGKVESQEKAN